MATRGYTETENNLSPILRHVKKVERGLKNLGAFKLKESSEEGRENSS